MPTPSVLPYCFFTIEVDVRVCVGALTAAQMKVLGDIGKTAILQLDRALFRAMIKLEDDSFQVYSALATVCTDR